MKPIERESEGDRANKLCRCSQCNVVAKCIPDFDFYSDVYGLEDKDLLVCESCMRTTANQVLSVSKMLG